MQPNHSSLHVTFFRNQTSGFFWQKHLQGYTRQHNEQPQRRGMTLPMEAPSSVSNEEGTHKPSNRKEAVEEPATDLGLPSCHGLCFQQHSNGVGACFSGVRYHVTTTSCLDMSLCCPQAFWTGRFKR